MRASDARAPAESRFLGIGTAIAVALVLSLLKLGAFFLLHPHMVHWQSALRDGGSDPALAVRST